jgi:membrane-associated phospholipid phosphatase
VNDLTKPTPAALPPTLRRPIGAAAVVAGLVTTVLGMIYAAGATLGGFDGVEPARDHIRPPLVYLALVVDYGGEPIGAAIVVTAVVTLCLALGHRRAAVLAIAGSALTVATTTLLKPVVDRTIHGDFLAYPSGHTALITALALIMALVAADRMRASTPTGTLLVLAAAGVGGAAMAWAQVALGAHYPTDTVGGFCTAIAVIPATAWLVDRAADRLRDRASDTRPNESQASENSDLRSRALSS